MIRTSGNADRENVLPIPGCVISIPIATMARMKPKVVHLVLLAPLDVTTKIASMTAGTATTTTIAATAPMNKGVIPADCMNSGVVMTPALMRTKYATMPMTAAMLQMNKVAEIAT